jgi:glucokinase
MIGAVDIGGTKIAAGVLNEEGRILASAECATEPGHGYGDALDRITAMLRSCSQQAGGRIGGIGIGCTGPVYPVTGLIGDVDFLKGWKGANPVRDLAERFGVSVAMENDADAAALGEASWGAGRGRDPMIFVTVGTGIGGGILIDGKLYRGVDGAHPEIGHHVIEASGPRCFCGASGCWEVLARGPAMAEWMRAHAPAGHPAEPLSAERICEMARSGDELAKKAVEREARYLGLGLANLVTLFTPEVIILGGNVMKSADLLMSGMRAEIGRNCGLVPFERTEIRLASLGPQTGLIGAARVWYHRFDEIGG